MTATIRNAELARFVAAVRQALDDLTPDELDELTGGLEADLDDALAEDPAAGVAAFGDPAAYAAELRAAAGLPSRADRGGRRGTAWLGGAQQLVQRRAEAVRAHPRWPGVRDFALTLRPVWWVLRGWVAYQLLRDQIRGSGVSWLLPLSSLGWLLLAVLVVASVEVGRRWAAPPGRPQRWVLRAANTVAALALLPLVSSATTVLPVPLPPPGQEVIAPSNGLWLDGVEVRNVFPYDANGKPLTDVQLFDENGRSLSVGTAAQTPLLESNGPFANQRSIAQVPAVDPNNRPVWNVYPLRQQELDPTDPASGSAQGRPVAPPVPATPARPAPAQVLPPASAVQQAPSAQPSVAPSVLPSAQGSAPVPVPVPAPVSAPVSGSGAPSPSGSAPAR